jgi:hypothetical protein
MCELVGRILGWGERLKVGIDLCGQLDHGGFNCHDVAILLTLAGVLPPVPARVGRLARSLVATTTIAGGGPRKPWAVTDNEQTLSDTT